MRSDTSQGDIGGHPPFPGTRERVAPSAPPPIGCNLSTNRKRKPKWRRCVAAPIAVGPSAILTGSRTRPSDWGSNARFGPVEDRRNNRKLATFTQIWWLSPFTFFTFLSPFTSPDLILQTRFGGCHLSPFNSLSLVPPELRMVFPNSRSPVPPELHMLSPELLYRARPFHLLAPVE